MRLALLLLAACDGCTQPPIEDVYPCGDDEVWRGEDVCQPAEESCPDGRWGGLEAAYYVDVHAPPDGDGSADAPFDTVQEGADAAGLLEGGVVAVAAGKYREAVSLTKEHGAVELVGRCAAEVTIDANGGDYGVALGAGVDQRMDVRGVTITGAQHGGVYVLRGTLDLQDSVVEGNAYVGAQAIGGDSLLRMEGVTIRDTVPDVVGEHGYGAFALDGARIEATDVEIVGNTLVGVYLRSGATAIFDRVAVRDTLGNPDRNEGRGVELSAATLEATDLVVEGSTYAGVNLYDASSADLVRAEISGTTAGEHPYGVGLTVWGASTARCEECTISGNEYAGVTVEGTDALLELVGGTVSDNLESNYYGVGLYVINGASALVSGTEFRGNVRNGVFAYYEGTFVDLSQVTIADTRPRSDGWRGLGVTLTYGASASIAHTAITGSSGAGVSVEFGARLTLVESTISDTVPSVEYMGHGLNVYGGSALVVSSEISGSANAGIAVGDDGTVEAYDVDVWDTHADGEANPAGVLVDEEGTLIADDVRSHDNAVPGLWMSGDAATVTRCTFEDNAGAGVVLDAGALTMSDTELARNGDAGVAVIGAGTLDLDQVTVGAHDLAALWIEAEGAYVVAGSHLSGGPGLDVDGVLVHGNAVYATGTTAESLLLTGCTIRDSAVGVLLHGASATLDDDTWTDNTVDLVQQRCDDTESVVGSAPNQLICPATEYPVTTLDLEFE